MSISKTCVLIEIDLGFLLIRLLNWYDTRTISSSKNLCLISLLVSICEYIIIHSLIFQILQLLVVGKMEYNLILLILSCSLCSYSLFETACATNICTITFYQVWVINWCLLYDHLSALFHNDVLPSGLSYLSFTNSSNAVNDNGNHNKASVMLFVINISNVIQDCQNVFLQ